MENNDKDVCQHGMISVLIVDDQEMLRIGLKCVLQQMRNVQVIGMACDGPQSVESARELQPDLILMDIGLPGYDGLEATRRIKTFLDCKVLILTSHSEDRYIFEALDAGAAGYCVKGASVTKLENAINTVARGVAWLDEMVSDTVLKSVV
ncbi:MAG: hypothetical protein C0507_07350 [Cyanobacteria bacterium PR.3.49]|jgi:DNA-binding NarL/FixJ family response regulator|nr:hypothetical protein [Cyanobacteria bacterium PR.3.49]